MVVDHCADRHGSIERWFHGLRRRPLTRWFCRKCWRTGDLEFGDMDQAQAEKDHRLQVKAGMAAIAKPWGSVVMNVPMDRFPGVHCAGEVLLGDTMHKKRFKPGRGTMFDGVDPGVK